MATKCIDLLTGTRTHDRRSITWTPHPASAGCPCCGTLEVTKGRNSTSYAVTEIPVGRGFGAGRGFQVVKGDGTTYSLFLADDRGHSTCDCPGHTYAATAKADRRHGDKFETLGCCHLDAINSLVWNGWLPESRTDAGADVGATEASEQELPECFRGVGPSRDGCPF